MGPSYTREGGTGPLQPPQRRNDKGDRADVIAVFPGMLVVLLVLFFSIKVVH